MVLAFAGATHHDHSVRSVGAESSQDAGAGSRPLGDAGGRAVPRKRPDDAERPPWRRHPDACKPGDREEPLVDGNEPAADYRGGQAGGRPPRPGRARSTPGGPQPRPELAAGAEAPCRAAVAAFASAFPDLRQRNVHRQLRERRRPLRGQIAVLVANEVQSGLVAAALSRPGTVALFTGVAAPTGLRLAFAAAWGVANGVYLALAQRSRWPSTVRQPPSPDAVLDPSRRPRELGHGRPGILAVQHRRADRQSG